MTDMIIVPLYTENALKVIPLIYAFAGILCVAIIKIVKTVVYVLA